MPGGLLGGALPQYRIYRLRDGWAAVAALEPHFAARFADLAGDDPAAFLAGLDVAACASLAAAHDLPIKAAAAPFSADAPAGDRQP